MLPRHHLLLDRSPNIKPLMSRWEVEKFKKCWKKSFRTFKILTLLYQQVSNLLIYQWDMSGPRLGALSKNRWSGVQKLNLYVYYAVQHQVSRSTSKVCAERENPRERPFSRTGGRDGNAQILGRESTGKQIQVPNFPVFVINHENDHIVLCEIVQKGKKNVFLPPQLTLLKTLLIFGTCAVRCRKRR